MRRALLVLVAAVAVLAPVVAAAPAVTGSDGVETAATAPGAKLSGVLGAQRAELGGEIDTRAFSRAVAAADSNASKARVLAAHADRVRDRLGALDARLDRLRDARENGSLSRGAYRAQVAELTARARTLERLADRLAAVAATLPAPALSEHGVNVTAVLDLSQRASTLVPTNAAAVAESVAGRQLGRSLGTPAPNATTEARVRAALERAERTIGRARAALDRANTGRDVSNETLAEARERIREAESFLDRARAALDRGNAADALALAESAENRARSALALLRPNGR